MAKVLIVDDEKGIREAYGKLVSQMEHEVFTAKNNEEANAIVLTERDLDIALIDRVFPGEKSGLDIAEFIRISQPLCQTVLMSGYPTFDSASEALRLSVFDYLTKPVTREMLAQVIHAAVEEKTLRQKKILDAEKNKKGYEELKTKQEMLQHDMRSLLIGITGFSNLLMNRTILDETQMEYCHQIQMCSVQLENMVNIHSKKCKFGGCSTKPKFNYPGEKTGLYCSIHKKENMIDVCDKKCNFDECLTRPNYN